MCSAGLQWAAFERVHAQIAPSAGRSIQGGRRPWCVQELILRRVCDPVRSGPARHVRAVGARARRDV